MFDFDNNLFAPAFSTDLTVDATLNAGAIEVDILVIDETRAATQTSQGVSVRSVNPAAVARIVELTAKGVAREAYKGSVLTFNGRSWEVRSYELGGSPSGEDRGLVRLLLMAVEPTA